MPDGLRCHYLQDEGSSSSDSGSGARRGSRGSTTGRSTRRAETAKSSSRRSSGDSRRHRHRRRHGPPRGYGDHTWRRHVGSTALTDTLERIQPRLMVCGHIHPGLRPIRARRHGDHQRLARRQRLPACQPCDHDRVVIGAHERPAFTFDRAPRGQPPPLTRRDSWPTCQDRRSSRRSTVRRRAVDGHPSTRSIRPLAQSEIRGGTLNVVDELFAGHAPKVTGAPGGRAAFADIVAERLLRLLAAQSANLLSFRKVGARLDTHHDTVEGYVARSGAEALRLRQRPARPPARRWSPTDRRR